MKSKDYSKLIIWAALWVTVARYVGAFLASDLGKVTGPVSDGLTVLMALSGLGMGFLDVLGLAYVFDGWRKTLPKAGDSWSNRFKVLTAFVISLFVVGVGILVPFTVARISSAGMAETLHPIGQWAWALAVNLAPYLLIGGVTFSHSGFVRIDQPESTGKKSEEIGTKPEQNGAPDFYGYSWRDIPAEERAKIAGMPTRIIVDTYGVSDRLARDWREKAKLNGKVTHG